MILADNGTAWEGPAGVRELLVHPREHVDLPCGLGPETRLVGGSPAPQGIVHPLLDRVHEAGPDRLRCGADFGFQSRDVGPVVDACRQVLLEVHGSVDVFMVGGNLRNVVRLQLRMKMHAGGVAGRAGEPQSLALMHLRIGRFFVVEFVYQPLLYLRQVGVGNAEAIVGLDRDIGPQGPALRLVYDCGDSSGCHGIDGVCDFVGVVHDVVVAHGPVDAVVRASQICIQVTSTEIVEQVGNGDWRDFLIGLGQSVLEGQGQAARAQGGRVGLPGDGRLIDIDVVQRYVVAMHPACLSRAVLDLPPDDLVLRLHRVVLAQDLIASNVVSDDPFPHLAIVIASAGSRTHIEVVRLGRTSELGALGSHGIPPDG